MLNDIPLLLITLWLSGISVWLWRNGAPQVQRELRQLRDANRHLEQRVTWLLDELAKARTEIARLSSQVGGHTISARWLLVGIAADPALAVDLTVFRDVCRGGALQWKRLMPLTLVSLKRHLDRKRRAGNGYRYLHLACHGGPEGLRFDDGLATGEALSEHLAGVEVLVLAACSADAVGDLLGVVPFVVSMAEEITHEDARVFGEVFWEAVAMGLHPERAFAQALERCPPVVAEFAELHT